MQVVSSSSPRFIVNWNDSSLFNHDLFQLPLDFECILTKYANPFQICVWSRHDDLVVSSVLAKTGLWERDRVNEFVRAMKLFDRSVVLDVGANLGVFTLAAAVAGASSAIAFEPIPAHVALIAESLRRNRNTIEPSRVRLVAAGASNRTGGARILMNMSNRGGSSFLAEKLKIEGAHDARAVDCNVTTIDSVVRERVHVMKIDVEGFESCVIDGARQLFERHGVCFLFLEFWFTLRPCGARSVVDYLFELGYEAYRSFDEFEQGRSALDSGMIKAMSMAPLAVLDLLFWKVGCSPRPPPLVVTLAPDIVQHVAAMANKLRLVSIVAIDVERDIVSGRNAANELVHKSQAELTVNEVELFMRFRKQLLRNNDHLMTDAQLLQNVNLPQRY
jgi:FkbM family methyltransferase